MSAGPWTPDLSHNQAATQRAAHMDPMTRGDIESSAEPEKTQTLDNHDHRLRLTVSA